MKQKLLTDMKILPYTMGAFLCSRCGRNLSVEATQGLGCECEAHKPHHYCVDCGNKTVTRGECIICGAEQLGDD